MLSFEEFQAVSNRDKIKGNSLGDNIKLKDKTPNSSSNSKAPQQTPTWRDKLGEILEHPLCQSLLIVVLVLDIFCSHIMVLSMKSELVSKLPHISFAAKSFASLANIVYGVELLAVYIAFDLRSLLHIGYVIDFLVICIQVYFETENIALEGKLLNFFRFWRFLRLYNVLINAEREQREDLQGEIIKLEQNIRQLSVDNDSVKLEVEKQKEARASVEKLLQNYKEEVDTLNEALKIAAMDIAEVAQDDEQLSSDDEQDEEEASLRQLLARKKSSLMAEGTDKSDVLRDILAGDSDAAAVSSTTSTILVHESGQFEVR